MKTRRKTRTVLDVLFRGQWRYRLYTVLIVVSVFAVVVFVFFSVVCPVICYVFHRLCHTISFLPAASLDRPTTRLTMEVLRRAAVVAAVAVAVA